MYTDYARTKLEGHDLFGDWEEQCRRYGLVNIRGSECQECTAGTWQMDVWHIDSYLSSSTGCQFDGRSRGVYSEYNFVCTKIKTLHFGVHPIKTRPLNTGLDSGYLVNPLPSKNTQNYYQKPKFENKDFVKY